MELRFVVFLALVLPDKSLTIEHEPSAIHLTKQQNIFENNSDQLTLNSRNKTASYPRKSTREFKIAAIFKELAYGETDSITSQTMKFPNKKKKPAKGNSLVLASREARRKLEEIEREEHIHFIAPKTKNVSRPSESNVIPASVIGNSFRLREILRENRYRTPEIDPSENYSDKPASLVREVPLHDINLSISKFTSEKSEGPTTDREVSRVTTKIPKFTMEKRPHLNHTVLRHIKQSIFTESKNANVVNVEGESTTASNHPEKKRNLVFAKSSYINLWTYHDYVVVVVFMLASILPIAMLLQVNYLKKNHITPTYCNVLMVNLLTVTTNRVLTYCIDPSSNRNLIPYAFVIFIHMSVQCCLIFCIGLFIVILTFPIYRPKSRVLPRTLAIFFFVLYIGKLSLYLFHLFMNDAQQTYLKRFKHILGAVNFGEIGAVTICFIILKLCTRQRHKIWWIRIYKKSLNDAQNSFSVLYSQLKKAIHLGIAAAFFQLLCSFVIVNNDFNLLNNYSYIDSIPPWVEPSLIRGLECSVCICLVMGSALLFVAEQRTTIKERGSLKYIVDVVKCKRRAGNVSTDGPRYPLNGIFTINKEKKPLDYATTDFQLVWSQNSTLPMTSLVGDDMERKSKPSTSNFSASVRAERKKIGKSLKSLSNGIADPFSTERKKPKHIKHSQSVDMLDKRESTQKYHHDIYDNIEFPKNRTPIYQNQYFHYDYRTKLHETSYTTLPNRMYDNGYAPMTAATSSHTCNNKKKKKKQSRPHSLLLDNKQKSNEKYMTSYFSALSFDRFNDYENCHIFSENANRNRQSTSENSKMFPNFEDGINLPMVSDERWKDIKITPKSCTIKVRNNAAKKELWTSKSVDLF